jgi:hypothetical protein
MKTFRKVFRVIVLIFVIALAASGAGMLGVFNPHTRERYMDKAISIEQVDKKKKEKEDEEDEEKD